MFNFLAPLIKVPIKKKESVKKRLILRDIINA